VNPVLDIVWSVPFLVGMVVGILGQRGYCWLKARWEDRHHPLPGGARHRIGGISRTWLGGLLVLFVVAYILAQGEQTHRDTVALSEQTAQCQADLIASIKRGREIGNQNDKLSIEQRELLAKIADALGEWVQRLIVLPPELADLPRTDPRVEQYGLDVSRVFFDRTAKYRERSAEIIAEQNRLADERAKNELPDPRCGQ